MHQSIVRVNARLVVRLPADWRDLTLLSRLPDNAHTRRWVQGAPLPPPSPGQYKNSGWSLRSPADPEQTTPAESVRALLEQLSDLAAFHELPPGSDIYLHLAVTCSDRSASVELSVADLATLAKIGADCDIEVSFLGDPPPGL